MEDCVNNEKNTLVHHYSRKINYSVWTHKLKKRFSNVLITSPVPILCLVWVWLASSIFNLSASVFLSIYKVAQSNSTCSRVSCNSYTFIPFLFIFLLTIFGYLSEKYKRYYVLMVGVFIVTVSSIFIMVLVVITKNVASVLNTHWTIIDINLLVNFTILLLGYVLFLYNSIQFTIDQLPDASSEQLATFTRWWVFVTIGGLSIASMILVNFLDWITKLAILFLLTIIFVFIGICFKRYFIIEPPPSVDPLKLIYRVLKYAWVHKYPVRRSAFTYNDNPSRLDYGKDRYGGPFTTDQVESVRSFWYILAVLLSATLFTCSSIDMVVSDIYFINPLNKSVYGNPFEVGLSYTSQSYFIVIGVPIIQFIVKPFFPCFRPSMLKSLWIGLFLMKISYLSLTIIYNLVSDSVFIKVSIGFSIINNIGSAILILVSLEFIIAQSPSNMQGILFGVYSLQFMVSNIVSLIVFNLFLPQFIFLCIVTSVFIISFIAYNLSMYCYKYRVRNESSDVNRRQVVEEVYERYLANSIQDGAIHKEDTLSVYSNTV